MGGGSPWLMINDKTPENALEIFLYMKKYFTCHIMYTSNGYNLRF